MRSSLLFSLTVLIPTHSQDPQEWIQPPALLQILNRGKTHVHFIDVIEGRRSPQYGLIELALDHVQMEYSSTKGAVYRIALEVAVLIQFAGSAISLERIMLESLSRSPVQDPLLKSISSLQARSEAISYQIDL